MPAIIFLTSFRTKTYVPSAEQTVKAILLESTSLQLDSIALDTTAGDTIRPPQPLSASRQGRWSARS